MNVFKTVTSKLLNASLIGALLLAPVVATAQSWTAPGTGKVTYPSGRTEPLDFGFAYEKTFNTFVFRAGQAKMRTDDMPPNYILNAIINKEGLIYIAEFADGFFQSFDLDIGKHKVSIAPRDEFDEEEPLAHLVVTINDDTFLVDTTHPSLKFEFDENGIADIKGSGLIRDLSSHHN